MLDENLLKYIHMQQAQGFSLTQIKKFLEKNGYNEKIIEEHLTSLLPRKGSFKPIYIILGVLLLLIIIGSLVFITWNFTQPVCGNGILEEGETRDSCCLDAGCSGDQSCEDNQCVEATCGECQFLRGDTCYDYECCSNEDCSDGTYCQENRCREVVCGYCEYQKENTCESYACCANGECSDFDETTKDSCLNPGLENATCLYEKIIITCKSKFDCNDQNNNTLDTCLNPGTKESTCESTLIVFECLENKDCNDNNNATGDYCTLDRTCAHPSLLSCKSGDDICPQGCLWEKDTDCDAY